MEVRRMNRDLEKPKGPLPGPSYDSPLLLVMTYFFFEDFLLLFFDEALEPPFFDAAIIVHHLSCRTGPPGRAYLA